MLRKINERTFIKFFVNIILLIFQGLFLLEYLIKHGSTYIVDNIKSRNMLYEIKMLKNYLCFDNGIEKGGVIR